MSTQLSPPHLDVIELEGALLGDEILGKRAGSHAAGRPQPLPDLRGTTRDDSCEGCSDTRLWRRCQRYCEGSMAARPQPERRAAPRHLMVVAFGQLVDHVCEAAASLSSVVRPSSVMSSKRMPSTGKSLMSQIFARSPRCSPPACLARAVAAHAAYRTVEMS